MIIHNKGVGGQNSCQGRARFAQDVLALQPQYVFLYFGLNDTLNEPAFLPLEEYLEHLTWMVDQARAAGIKPVLCTIHPVGEEPLLKRHQKESYGAEGPNGKINRYNAALRQMVEYKKGQLADFARVVAKSEPQGNAMVCDDGVHLTASGYKALAECFHACVAAELNSEDTIVCLGDSITWGAGVDGSGTTTGETYPAFLDRMLA